MPQAKTLEDAYANLKIAPLTNGRFDDFFVDTTEARGGDEISLILKRALTKDKLGNNHYLFTGARGCGKSTELMRLQRALPDFMLITFSVRDELDLYKFTHTELLIVTMKKLFEAAKDNNLDIDEKFLRPILRWADEINTSTTSTNELGIEAEAGVNAKVGLLNLFNAFTNLTTRAKYDTQVKKTIHSTEDKLISQFIRYCNIFIFEIKKQLSAINKGLLIIVEDLDKMDLKQGEELFLNYVSRLVALNVNTIYTYPISLKYHTRANSMLAAFDNEFFLPTIKTHNKNGSPYMEGGQLKIKAIVEKRMDLNLFEHEELLMEFIKYSGGVIWDLFRAIRNAMDAAMNRDRNIINEADWKKAYYKTMDDYRNMIADRVEGNSVVVKSSDYYATLIDTAISKTKQPVNTRTELELRQNLCILGYNGEGWIDVHPIVKEILILKTAIGAEYRIQ